MPTISFELKDLEKQLGKKLKLEELEKLLSYGKIELETYDKKTDQVTVNCGDTNLPYLWSAEGISRLIKGVLGKEKGIPKLNIEKGDYKVLVDNSVKAIRPFICAFVAKGKRVDEYTLKQIIQLQEKLCESFGRKRQKVAIGIYSYRQIKFPVHYKATNPESVKFIPLEFKREMTQGEILESHPKGKEFAWILEGKSKYPILMDSNNEVLSFPPIINSNKTGKVGGGEQDLFFEATGDDLNALILSTNIFAQALYERGFKIYSVDIDYSSYKDPKVRKITTPFIKTSSIKINPERVKNLLGIKLKESEMKNLVEKSRFSFNKFNIGVPCYRGDIMHDVDVIEDIGIMYGYNNLKPLGLIELTTGKTFEIIKLINTVREIALGLGYQEVLSPILTNKEILYNKMNTTEFGTIEITNPVSATYNTVRTWILPILMDALSKNKHISYPQKIFEQGLVTVNKKTAVVDYERIAFVSAHKDADYTEIRQCLDAIFNTLKIDYTIEKADHSSFMDGRAARVYIKDKKQNKIGVAYIGELNPAVLDNFELEVPVVGLELNITDLFNTTIKK